MEEKQPQVLDSRRLIRIGIAVGFLLIAILGGLILFFKNPQTGGSYPDNGTIVLPTVAVETISYKGKNGVDALTLLKARTTVEQDKSGLVVAINDKKADAKKREYWAFYVNGKMATVGPSDYKTKDTDMIEWKIERY